MFPSNSSQHLTRAATAPAPSQQHPVPSLAALSLPVRRLSTRKTIPTAHLDMLSTGGLQTPPNSNPQSSHIMNNPADDLGLARRAARTYHSGPQLIMPYLYLGGASNVCSSGGGGQLRALEITHVLNVAREVTTTPPMGVVYRHCRWDHDEQDLERYFAECFAFIDGARLAQQGVLVHCQLGVSRSASLVIAYVMRTMGLGFTPAYEYVRLRAPCISPNLSLIAQLSEYGEKLAGSRTAVPRPLRPPIPLPMQEDGFFDSVPDLETDVSSAAGSENSSPVETAAKDDEDRETTEPSVDLMTMPIKRISPPLLVLPALPSNGRSPAGAGNGLGPHVLRVIAGRHPLVP
ncbi:hypothetical protein GGI21_001637 [Coemansia aciculifera]|uniref:Uncharacterized protein n=1 Tax=Coemansia aciculifera TaxID=417176 RepID=A0ACC1M922_9FUNG|nr:hypothetical protein IWW38_000699 [Coemansia aciculifera]KAJ2909684.1 hypothetical protein GGI21_001637 [Coemansia aciculifera]